MKTITKTRFSITIDKKLNEILNEDISNKSKYIEWLIYNDLKKNVNNEKIKKLAI